MDCPFETPRAFALAESTMTSVSLVVVASMVLFITMLSRTKRVMHEPPFVYPSIPVIGHILGLFWYKMKYYTLLCTRNKHKIFTLPILGRRMYIITSPILATSVQKHHMTFSFWWIEAHFSVKLSGISKETATHVLRNAAGREEGIGSMMVDGVKGTHVSMISGLDNMNRISIDFLGGAIEQVVAKRKLARMEIDLCEWVRHNVFLAVSSAVYGPENPYFDPEIEDGLLAFSNAFEMLLISPFPRLLVPKGYSGREKVIAAFRKYFQAANSLESASDLIKLRIKDINKYNVSNEDIARMEAVTGFGVLLNVPPTAFWTIYHVFSDPKILRLVREIVEPLINTSQNQDGTQLHTIDVRKIRDIALLSSILNESIRYHSNGAAPRLVMEDTMLDGQYLLKKDSVLMVPRHEIHFDPEAWGENAGIFDPFRFVNAQGNKKKSNAAFQGFGSGVNLCPGKNFAMTTILAALAMLVVRFDIVPVAGEWSDPGHDGSNMALGVFAPKNKLPVSFTARKGWENGSWAFKLV